MSRQLFLALSVLISLGLAFTSPSRAQDELGDELRDFTCANVSLFTQCQGGLASCGTLGGSCAWCAVAPGATVKDCVFSENDGCSPSASGSASCGRQYNGVCVDNGSGGTVCEGTSAGDCPNSAQHKCS